jgi:hypothetical protein
MDVESAAQISVVILAASRAVSAARRWKMLGIEYVPLTMFVWMTFNGFASFGLLGAVLISLPTSAKVCDQINERMCSFIIKKQC